MADKKIRLLVQAEVKKAVQALNKVEKEQKDIKKQNDGLKKSFATIGGVIASAFSIQAIARFTQESIKLGSQTISLTRSFTNLGKGIGLNEESLKRFRKATDGTVSDVDLMIQANNAMLLGVVQNEEEFSELIDSAQRLAKAVGKDTLFGIESLTTGIGRQSRLMLDNLGIIVKAEDAYKAMAQATGKSVAALTDLERKQAFITATMESVRSKVANLGDEELDATDATLALSSAFKNLQGTIGIELQDEVETTAGLFANLLSTSDLLIQKIGLLNFATGNVAFGLAQANTEAKKAAEEGMDDFIDRLQRIPETDPMQQASAQAESFGRIQGNYQAHNDAMAAIDEDALNFRMGGLENEFFQREAFNKQAEQDMKEHRKAAKEAHEEKIAQNLEAAILQGQSAKQAGISVVKAEVAEAQAGLISSIMKSLPFPINLAVAAGAGGMIGKVTDSLFSSFATGGSFVTKGRTTLPLGNGVVVGDNASGMERIDVTPLPSPTSNGNNITINISAPLVDETVVDTIIPAIRRAEKLNL